MTLVLDLDEKVAATVGKLKERSPVSAYLRAFVMARINPLRWIQEPAPLDELLKTIRERVATGRHTAALRKRVRWRQRDTKQYLFGISYLRVHK
jgi:hypothetical protein